MSRAARGIEASPLPTPYIVVPNLELPENNPEPKEARESGSPNLCLIIPLPTPEFIDQKKAGVANDNPKPTNIEAANLQKMFDTRNNSSAETRVKNLLLYAWELTSEDAPVIPKELEPFVTNDLQAWFVENLDRVRSTDPLGDSFVIAKEYTDPLKNRSSFFKKCYRDKQKVLGQKRRSHNRSGGKTDSI